MDLITARPALNNVDVFVKGVMLTFPLPIHVPYGRSAGYLSGAL